MSCDGSRASNTIYHITFIDTEFCPNMCSLTESCQNNWQWKSESGAGCQSLHWDNHRVDPDQWNSGWTTRMANSNLWNWSAWREDVFLFDSSNTCCHEKSNSEFSVAPWLYCRPTSEEVPLALSLYSNLCRNNERNDLLVCFGTYIVEWSAATWCRRVGATFSTTDSSHYRNIPL